MTSFCFLANYHLTPLQIQIAKRLESDGSRCSFVAVNAKLAQEVRDGGWSEDALLYLPFDPPSGEPPFDEVRLPFNDLVLADRALRYVPQAGLWYLYRAARAMEAFFDRRDINIVLGEVTWAHERLAAALCVKTAGRKFLTPFTVRYPANRWGFFEDGEQSRLLRINDGKGMSKGTSARTTQDGPPSYLKRNDQLLREARRLTSRLKRLRRYITRERIDPRDPTHIQSRWNTLRRMGGEEVNRVRYKNVVRTPVDQVLLSSPFVVFALHKQPEASIDVLGRYYEDQTSLIMSVWRSLPSGWRLLVKEHTNAIGDRPPSFYRRLSRWPGLEVIDENTSMAALIESARAVFTVTGTVAFEAAMRGTAAFTFAPMFFNCLPRSRRLTPEDLRQAGDVATLIEGLPPYDPASTAAALQQIGANSFAGRFTDVVSDPSVLDEKNLDELMTGFRSLCSVRCRKAY